MRRRSTRDSCWPGFYVIYAITRAVINPALAPKLPPEQANVPLGTVVWALATSSLPLALLIVSVLGAILFGLATPCEAAAIGALDEHRAGGGVLIPSTSR